MISALARPMPRPPAVMSAIRPWNLMVRECTLPAGVKEGMPMDVPDGWDSTARWRWCRAVAPRATASATAARPAILLAKAGAKVVVADRDLKLARRTVEMIESVGGQASAVEVDVTRSSDCAALVRTAVERFGRLDVLDNNVGIGSRGSVVDLGEDEWRRVMQVNVETMFLVAKHAIPA